MIFLIEAKHPLFCDDMARSLFQYYQSDLDDTAGFDYVRDHSLFFNVYRQTDGGFVGCVFAFCEQGRVYVGGYALRHRHKECVLALRRISSLFTCVYAKTRHRTAEFCLRRAGFKRQKGEKHVWFKTSEDITQMVCIPVFLSDFDLKKTDC